MPNKNQSKEDLVKELKQLIDSTMTKAIVNEKGKFEALKKDNQRFKEEVQKEVKKLNNDRTEKFKSICDEALESLTNKYRKSFIKIGGQIGWLKSRRVMDLKLIKEGAELGKALSRGWSRHADIDIEDHEKQSATNKLLCVGIIMSFLLGVLMQLLLPIILRLFLD